MISQPCRRWQILKTSVQCFRVLNGVFSHCPEHLQDMTPSINAVSYLNACLSLPNDISRSSSLRRVIGQLCCRWQILKTSLRSSRALNSVFSRCPKHLQGVMPSTKTVSHLSTHLSLPNSISKPPRKCSLTDSSQPCSISFMETTLSFLPILQISKQD